MFKLNIQKYLIVLLVFVNIKLAFSLENRSYLMPDTPVIISNCSTDFSSKDKPYFPINWYESYASDMKHYTFTDWKPYAPNFIPSYNDLSTKDAFHRIEKLAKDSIATGVIIYNQLNDKKASPIISKIVNSINIEYYIQIYEKVHRKSEPLERFPKSQRILEKYRNVNWYFIDDYNSFYWTSEKAELFSKILRSRDSNKYLISACSLNDYLGCGNYILNDVDIVAPQLYPLYKTVLKSDDLYNAIPEFYHHDKYHKWLLKGKKLIIDYNKKHDRKIYYFVTLAIFHNNKLEEKATVIRFPTYGELRFQFFDAIICGAKGINFYSNFSCNKKTYENAKKIISEFRNTGFEKAVINGKYSPSLICLSSRKNDKENNKISGIDFCCYKYNKTLYVIISNFTNEYQKITLALRNKKSFIIGNSLSNKRTFQNFDISFKPFEIKLLKIIVN